MVRKILIVEDTRNIREIVGFLLKGRGYEVVEASDGVEALEKAFALLPDLVLLDAMLPRKSGFEVCAELKADARSKHIPILMLTAVTRDTGKSDEYWKEKTRADAFMSKPFKAAELVERVEQLLGGGAAPAPPETK